MRSVMRGQNSQQHSRHEGGPCSRQSVTFSKADFYVIFSRYAIVRGGGNSLSLIFHQG